MNEDYDYEYKEDGTLRMGLVKCEVCGRVCAENCIENNRCECCEHVVRE